jgi:hypothetical protein
VFNEPRIYMHGEAAQLRIRDTGVSDLAQFRGSVFDAEPAAGGYEITRRRVESLEVGATRILSADAIATTRSAKTAARRAPSLRAHASKSASWSWVNTSSRDVSW